MSVLQLKSPIVPPGLRGPVLYRANPSFDIWPVVWANVLAAGLSVGTTSRHLGYIDRFYRSDVVAAVGDIEAAIARADFAEIETAMLSFLTVLRNDAARKAALRRKEVAPGTQPRREWAADHSPTWRSVLNFLVSLLRNIEVSSNPSRLAARLQRFEALHSQLGPRPKKAGSPLRSLPAIVLKDLSEIFDPSSPRNPFKTKRNRVRNNLLFITYSFLGLRRGEALILAADAFSSEYDPYSQVETCWVTVETLDDEDWRHAAPSLKTPHSTRQLPIPSWLYELAQAYLENFRGRQEHAVLFSSQKDRPLAAQSVNDIFRRASGRLSEEAQRTLQRQKLTSVSPRNLRHTAAVGSLKAYRDSGDPMAEALGKLRVFFGWSFRSKMPHLYASAYWRTDVADIEDRSFDAYVAALRELDGSQSVLDEQ